MHASADAGAPEPPSVEPGTTMDPNDPFAPYPGAAELCNRLVIQDKKPLHWRSWTTRDEWTKVAEHYKARAKGAPVRESTDRVELHSPPDRVLMIYPAAVASTKPQCDKPLAAGDKTVIMLSELRMPQ